MKRCRGWGSLVRTLHIGRKAHKTKADIIKAFLVGDELVLVLQLLSIARAKIN